MHKAGPVYSRLANSCTGPERIDSAVDIFSSTTVYLYSLFDIFQFFERLTVMIRVRVSGEVRASDSFVILLHFIIYGLGQNGAKLLA